MNLLNLLKNERGNVLTYVLLILLVLMITTPVILASSSTTQLSNVQTEYEKKATDLAVSGMEAFMNYLQQYPVYGNGMDRKTYFNKYGEGSGTVGLGWGTKTIQLPEGTNLTFNQYVIVKDSNPETTVTLPLTSDNDYDVIFMASVNNSVHSKKIKYQISTFEPASGGTKVLTDGQKVAIPSGGNVLYGTGSNISAIKNTTIKDAIATYIDGITSATNKAVDGYLTNPTLITCTACTMANIITNINSSANNPVIIYRPGTLSFSGTFSIGTPAKPVILIADNIDISDSSNLLIYGSLIANKTSANPSGTGTIISRNNSSQLTIFQATNGKYGDLWAEGNMDFENQTNITADNSIYANNFTIKNDSDITSKSFTINEKFYAPNKANITTNTGALAAGEIELKNDSILNIKSGDVLVENNLIAHNKINITAGGVIAVGATIDFKNNSTINAGTTGQTSLDLSGSASGGGSTPPKDWTPIRQ
ncbi:hypothetical protein SAMN04487897_10556 [Paenibacillus sp. yr247]|uniref:hypothetical protein n=1 Tax=Paenibacillus sp. yr247 TaxID=1761880 RepID=UPI00088BE4A8|nr:hypothetical protein [Paenibacillus sp. yr247]SDN82678.1 hypothetical protein SAMN04487897_10556 [Paenibacillus sp. yr247]